MKYRKKQIIVEAVVWRKEGDHPAVLPYAPVQRQCRQCGVSFSVSKTFTHGWIKTLEGGHIVCPGDFIVTGVAGEHYPCKPDIFAATYDEIDEGHR